MKKIDIMNMREDEKWEIVNGKTIRVSGPTVKTGIKEAEIKETVTPKLSEKTEEKKKSKKKKLKKI